MINTKSYKLLFCISILLFLSCKMSIQRANDISNIVKSLKMNYGMDSLNVTEMDNSIIVTFPVSYCVYFNKGLNISKNSLAMEFMDSTIFKRIDSLFVNTYLYNDKNKMIYQVNTSEILNSNRRLIHHKRIHKIEKYINKEITCEWIYKGNQFIEAYNKTYFNERNAPKFGDIIELLLAASRETYNGKGSTSIITLEYFNETIKSRINEWPTYGNHVDTILNIIKSE